jgi:hypothetical protein
MGRTASAVGSTPRTTAALVGFDTATPLRQVGVAKPRKEEPQMSRDQTEYHAVDEASF